jgi:ABC-2 type transport system permease protein
MTLARSDVSPSVPARAATTPAPRRSMLRIYALEAKSECLKLLRMPAFAVPSVAFPWVFYILFALAFGGGRSAGSTSMSTYLLATYGAFGVIGVSLFGFGVGVATERGQGWMLLKRASPMPPGAYFAAKTVMALAFAVVIVLGLFALGAAFGGVALPTALWVLLAVTLVAGAVPFCALGLALGYLCGPNSAPAVVNLLYLPAAFASGLWFPVQVLPGFVQALAPWLPPYYLGQLALATVGVEPRSPLWVCVGALVLTAVLALAVARLAYVRDRGKTYG